MNVVRFHPDHLRELNLQPAQSMFGGLLTDPEYGRQLTQGQAFTGIADGKIVGCAGCVEIWENRAQAWALIAAHAGRHILAVHRCVHGFLQQVPWRRVEAYVDVDFDAGQKWIRLLGFEYEGRARAYMPDGRDNDLFARVR